MNASRFCQVLLLMHLPLNEAQLFNIEKTDLMRVLREEVRRRRQNSHARAYVCACAIGQPRAFACPAHMPQPIASASFLRGLASRLVTIPQPLVPRSSPRCLPIGVPRLRHLSLLLRRNLLLLLLHLCCTSTAARAAKL